MDTQMSFTEALSQSGLEVIDFVILLIYIVMLVSLGVILSYNRESKTKSTTDYFLAGNTLTWWAVGASLIAANISTEQFIGMAGTGYADGIAIAAYEIMAAVTLVIIGKFLLPVMMSRGIFTVPQFFRQRYTSGVGLAFSILWLFLYIFVNLTSVAWLGALAFEQVMGLQGFEVEIFGITLSVRLVIVFLLFIIAGIYSINGGMTSVAWTDVVQITFIIGGGLATAYFAVRALSGENGTFEEGCETLYVALQNANFVKDTHFHLVIQKSQNTSAYMNVPGIAAIVGGLWLTNLSYWAFNQYIIQKGLAAQSIREAQKGVIFAAFLKIAIPFIVLVPGLCAYYIIQRDEQLTLEGVDNAYAWLIHNEIPTGIKGLAIAALAASIISSLGSMINSTSTIFTIDIYRRHIKPDASDKRLVNVGRISAFVALIIALIAANPLLGEIDQAFQYVQEYSGFIYPGVTIVGGMGLLWKRASTPAAIWTAILTIPLGVIAKILLPNMPFLMRAGYVFIVLLVLFVTISLLSHKNIDPSQSVPVAYRTLLKRWGYSLGAIAFLCILMATVVTAGAGALPPEATPDNSTIAYLNDIGFQAFFFFGALVGACAFILLSNANDKRQDHKALPIDLTLFSTTRGYTIGTAIICAITIALYVLLW